MLTQGLHWACQVALMAKNPPINAGDVRDMGLVPGSGRSPAGGHRNPLQYSCLENPMDRGLWRAKVRRVAKSRIWLKRLSMHSCKVSIITGSIVSHRVKAIKGPLHWKALHTRLTTQEPFLSWVDQCFSQKCHLLRFNEWINEQMNECILKSSSET